MPFVMFLLVILAILAALGIAQLFLAGLMSLARMFWAVLPYVAVAYVLYVLYCKVTGKEPIKFTIKKEEAK